MTTELRWDTLTVEGVFARFNPHEAAALHALQDGRDQLAVIIDDLTKTIRGQILAGGMALGPDGTLPVSLWQDAISLAIWNWISAFSKNQSIQTDYRKDNAAKAGARLDKVAAGTLRVELPDAGTAQDIPTPRNVIKVVSADHRQTTRHETRGL